MFGFKEKPKKYEETVYNPLLNVIAPMGLEFLRTHFFVGDNKARVYGVVKYPQTLEYGWLSKLTNIPNTVTTISYEPIESGNFVQALSKNIQVQAGIIESTHDALIRSRAEKAYEQSQNIMTQIDQNAESVGEVSITIMPVANSQSMFEKVCNKVESTCSMLRLKTRILPALQKEGFRQISPFYTLDSDIRMVTNRVVPLATIMGGFPFASSGFSDENGYILGKDTRSGLIVIDHWLRGNDRNNSNIVVMGIAGVGKSTLIKKIALNEWVDGTKIIFIDPESEYKYLCQKLGGDWIDASGTSGKSQIINPLQIRPVPGDVDEENTVFHDDGYGIGAKALHLKTLDLFFSQYIPSITDIQKSLLKKALIELYDEFGIYWNTDITKIPNENFPIMADLYEFILECLEREKELNSTHIKDYESLSAYLYNIAHGDDQFLWNGHTNVHTKSRCICFDTRGMQSFSSNLKSTQYFNILSWCWEEMSRDRTERVMLFCDEAYILIDPNVPQTLAFMRNMEKRARKYEAGVAIISHSVVDFLDESVKMYGQALLDIPTYKYMFGCDGKNLLETKELYDLTEAEEELLASKKRKNALMMIGSRRIHGIIEVTDKEFDYMGKAGGR